MYGEAATWTGGILPILLEDAGITATIRTAGPLPSPTWTMEIRLDVLEDNQLQARLIQAFSAARLLLVVSLVDSR